MKEIRAQIEWRHDMRMIRKSMWVMGVMIALFVITISPAFAYIDSCTASMIVQAVAAVVLTNGAMFIVSRQANKKIGATGVALGLEWENV
jgi:delta-aminolevulinic acid dehydratase/porphobilinogen synthase